eukprot:4919891-Pleurochrysis_carterae.AAC.1
MQGSRQINAPQEIFYEAAAFNAGVILRQKRDKAIKGIWRAKANETRPSSAVRAAAISHLGDLRLSALVQVAHRRLEALRLLRVPV